MAGVVFLYFKHGAKNASVALPPDGKLDLRSLAAALGLDPVGVKAGPIIFDFDPSTGQSPDFANFLRLIRRAMGDRLLGSSAERPITLQAAVFQHQQLAAAQPGNGTRCMWRALWHTQQH